MAALMQPMLVAMLCWDGNSRAAKSLDTANENKPKCSSHRWRSERQELPTSVEPQVGRDCQQEMPSAPLPTLKWGLGRGESCLHPFQLFSCTACTWALLGWPCLPTCSITVSFHDWAFPQGISLNETSFIKGWWTQNSSVVDQFYISYVKSKLRNLRIKLYVFVFTRTILLSLRRHREMYKIINHTY